MSDDVMKLARLIAVSIHTWRSKTETTLDEAICISQDIFEWVDNLAAKKLGDMEKDNTLFHDCGFNAGCIFTEQIIRSRIGKTIEQMLVSTNQNMDDSITGINTAHDAIIAMLDSLNEERKTHAGI